jgi:hypothetical protein
VYGFCVRQCGPQRQTVCERLGSSLRRECLDLLIPFKRTPSSNDDSGLGYAL